MLEEISFKPPARDKKVWATYVKTRSPEFKIHAKEGHATSAISLHWRDSDTAKYVLLDGQWFTEFSRKRPETCSECHLPLSRKISPEEVINYNIVAYNNYIYTVRQHWLDDYLRPWESRVVCTLCMRKHECGEL